MWKTFLATFQAPWYIIGMERNQKMGGPTDDDQERQEATDTPDMSRPGATEAHASREHQLLTVKEAVALFNRNGIHPSSAFFSTWFGTWVNPSAESMSAPLRRMVRSFSDSPIFVNPWAMVSVTSV